MESIEECKKRAAIEAVKHVEDGFTVGLGSGSTASYAIKEMAKRIKEDGLQVMGVPTSNQAMLLALSLGIPITTLHEHPRLDLAIDGADEIDKALYMIKGAGGALTREKIVACASKRVVIVADETKMVERLGTNHSVPIEVLSFALSTVMSRIREMKGKPVLREGSGKVGPVITDNGNFIVDVDFGPIEAPKELNCQIEQTPGVIGTGLFIEIADIVYVGKSTGVQKLKR